MNKRIPKNKTILSVAAGNYARLLTDIKQRIRTAQTLSCFRELLLAPV